MREARLILEGSEAYYSLSNELTPKLPDLNGDEQEELVNLLFDAAKFCHIEILAYTAYPRGYGMLVKTPEPYDVGGKLLAKQAIEYFGAGKGRELAGLSRGSVSGKRIAASSRRLRDKLFNLQEFAKLYANRFSRSYNSRHHRKGQVWKQRFRSSVVENESGYLTNAIAHIHTRPVAMDKGTSLTDYRYSSWVEALNGNRKWRRIYKQISGDSHWRHAESGYASKLDAMAKRINRPDYGSIDPALIDAYRLRNRMLPEELKARKRRWQAMYRQLKEYVAENGHFLFPRDSGEHRELVKWVRAQRHHYLRGTLSKSHIGALDAIGFPWNVKGNIIKGSTDPNADPSSAWMKKYRLMKAHSIEKGGLTPPYPSRMMGQWVSYQRAQRKRSRLSETQIKMLDAIGFPWDVARGPE